MHKLFQDSFKRIGNAQFHEVMTGSSQGYTYDEDISNISVNGLPSHGFTPEELGISVLVQIPKSKDKT